MIYYLLERRARRKEEFILSIANAIALDEIESMLIATPYSVDDFEGEYFERVNKLLALFDLPLMEKTESPGVYQAGNTTIRLIVGGSKDGVRGNHGKRLSTTD